MPAFTGHTTGRETLASSGSHCPAAPLQKPPVGEQRWLSPRNASDPVRCLPPMTSQRLEFPMRPSRQNTVDVSQGRVESRLVVPAVVIDPTPDVAVEHPGEVIQRFVAALVKRPASDRLSDQLLRPVLQVGSLPDPATHRPYSGSMGASEVQVLATPSATNSALDR